MHPRKKVLAAALAALFAASQAAAAEVTLPDVVVPSPKDAPLTQPDPLPWAHDSVSREGIGVLGGPAQTSTFRLFDLMPSVNTESADAYGISANRNLNLRGRTAGGGGGITFTVDGMPTTIGPGGADLFDLENIGAYDLYRGAMPAGVGLGVSNILGVADMTLRRPEKQFGIEASQGFGSFGFRRTFARLDSGSVGPAGTAFFVSASDMQTDKWKGAGQSERRNAMFGLAQPFSNGARIEVFALFNHIAANDYRAMNYAQAQDKSNWRRFDYDEVRNPAQQQLYYGFNRQEFDDIALMANLILPVGENGRFTLRTHYLDDDGYMMFGAGVNRVRRWDIEHKQTGLLAQYDLKLSRNVDLAAGYWWMTLESPPPPVYQKDYGINADGSLTFAQWALLSKHGDHKYRSPFVQLTGRLGPATLSGGLRLMEEYVPSLSYFNAAGLPDGSYDGALAANPPRDPWMQIESKDLRTLLPNLSLRYDLTPDTALTAAYGRRVGGTNSGATINTYIANRNAFVSKGVTLQDVIGKLEPEVSDNVDLGVRYAGERLSLASSIYYSRARNGQVNVFDPTVGVSYNQCTARTIGKGVELEGSYRVSASLSALFAASYNRFAFDGDILTRSGTPTPTDGKQVPNAARVLGRFGLDWRSGDWSVSPMVRYTGKRYGDILQKEEVDAYWVADVHLGYRWRNVGALQDVGIHASVLNLFDKRYIGMITPNSTDLNAGTSYYAGAPRTVAVTMTAKF